MLVHADEAFLWCNQSAFIQVLAGGNLSLSGFFEVGFHLYPSHIRDTTFIVHLLQAVIAILSLVEGGQGGVVDAFG